MSVSIILQNCVRGIAGNRGKASKLKKTKKTPKIIAGNRGESRGDTNKHKILQKQIAGNRGESRGVAGSRGESRGSIAITKVYIKHKKNCFFC